MALRKRYIVASALTAFGVLISQFPASWAAKLAPQKLDVTLGGTIWNGHLPSVNALPAINFETSPSGLITEKPLIKFDGNGNGISISGTAQYHQIETLTLKGDALFLGKIDGRLSNLKGQFDLMAKTLNFNGDCADVTGHVSTDILARNAAQWQWTGPALKGPISCVNGILTTTLSGNIPGQSVEAVLKVIPDGTYQIRAVINTNTP